MACQFVVQVILAGFFLRFERVARSVGVIWQAMEETGVYSFGPRGNISRREMRLFNSINGQYLLAYLDSKSPTSFLFEPCYGPHCAERFRVVEEASKHLSCQNKIVYISFSVSLTNIKVTVDITDPHPPVVGGNFH